MDATANKWVSIIFPYSFLMFFLFVLPGCIKTYKIFKNESPQGEPQEIDYRAVKENLRSKRVYQEWQTVAIFDALLLSNKVRKLHADSYVRRLGKDVEFGKAFLRRQLEENKLWVSFYLLADIRCRTHTLLTDKDAAWTLYLQTVRGDKIALDSIEEVELPPEIESFFGYRATDKKLAYLVKFPAKNLQGTLYAGQDVPLKLVLSSVELECYMYWGDHPDIQKDRKKVTRVIKKVPSKKEKLEKDEDYYWL